MDTSGLGSTADSQARVDALRDSEERYRAFIRLSSEGIWRFEMDEPVSIDLPVAEQIRRFFAHGYLAECNDAMARMYGFASADELTGRRLTEFHDPANPDSIAFLEAFIANGYRLTDAESNEPDRDGVVHTFLNSFVAVIEDRHLIRAWGTQRDVTEQRRTEERYRELFDSIDQGFCVIEMLFDELTGQPVDYRFIEVNAAFEHHTGLVNATGRTVREMLPTYEQHWFDVYGRVAITGEPARFEQSSVPMKRWFDVYAFRTGRPEERRVAILFKDISVSKLIELALRESEARFRNMSDHAPVMIWVTDPAGQCTYLNKQWYDFTGQTEQDALGLGWLDVVHPDDAKRSGDMFMTANERHERFTLEYRLRRSDGEYRWCVDAAAPRFGEDGSFQGYIGSVIDITDRALAEREREQLLVRERAARADAEHASRMKDEFLATLSHELRTPLNAILGWSQILQKETDGDPVERAQGLDVIERNARAQAQIIDDLLDMSRIISGKVRLDVQRIDLPAVVQLAIDTARPAADGKGVRLQAIVDPLHDVVVTGDAGRLQQVLWNLLTNAVKFTPRGGRVQVLLERVNSHLELSVIDNGEGISPDFLPHVFDRFRQADASTTRRHGGLGLGLSIVKQLVELHGGLVQARSAGVGKGATFVVKLPLTVVHPETAGSAAERRHPTASPDLSGLPDICIELKGVRVLVVDDEPDACRLIQRLLDDCEAIVTTVSSARAALDALARERFDVLVSDIGMPGEDGYALIRQVRAMGKDAGGNIPAIALTAYARSEDRVRAISAGFQMHVTKPVEPVELLTMISSAAGRTGRG